MSTPRRPSPPEPLAMRAVCELELDAAAVLPGDATLADVASAMVSGGTTAVLLHTDGGGEHIVTERDLTVGLGSGRGPEAPALDVATPETTVVDARASVLDAIALMLGRDLRNLPVVDGDGQVVGILTLREALSAAVGATESVPWVSALRLALHIELTSLKSVSNHPGDHRGGYSHS